MCRSAAAAFAGSAPLPKVWERSLSHDDDTKKIRLDLSPKVGERGVFHGAYIAIAGVVDKHIQAAKGLNCCIDSVLGLRFARNIQRKSSHPVAIPADNVVELEGIPSGRDDAMAGFEGGLRKCFTQTPRTTGNEPSLRPSDVHALIVADGRGRPGVEASAMIPFRCSPLGKRYVAALLKPS
jgi:hypothetical protein